MCSRRGFSIALASLLTIGMASVAADAASYKRCQRAYRACNSNCKLGQTSCFEQCQNNVFVCAHDVDVANGKAKVAARRSQGQPTTKPVVNTNAGTSVANPSAAHGSGGRRH